MIRGMFRYAFPAARSAVADAPKAAVNGAALAAAFSAEAAEAAAFTAAAAPIGGTRS